ncbi:hypothetical protein AB0C98_41930 [Streptomyces sp. NPDC048558]|uniref:cyanobactin maturation protease PatG family protein n=1 Tax=Streptomyces sp. NPDC048558 TaxID=3155759 RepID=UPI0034402379
MDTNRDQITADEMTDSPSSAAWSGATDDAAGGGSTAGPEQAPAQPTQASSAPAARVAGEPAPQSTSGLAPLSEAQTPDAAHRAVNPSMSRSAVGGPPPDPVLAGGIPQHGVRASCGGGDEQSPSSGCGCGGNGSRPLIYAIGTIGFDFQTDARRDSFRQQMDPVPGPKTADGRETEWQPNPYDPRQLRHYLAKNPWAADKLTWTLDVGTTPVYALEAEVSAGLDWTEPIFDRSLAKDEIRKIAEDAAEDRRELAKLLETLMYPPVSTVHRILRDAIVGQVLPVDDPDFVSRVSIPGVLTGRTTRLFSGQVLPVVEVKGRGVYTWNETQLITRIKEAVTDDANGRNTSVPDHFAKTVRAFLDKIYYQFRNLGQSSADRALNYAGTNAFLFGSQVSDGLLSAKHVPGTEDHFYALDTIHVSKSPHCRVGSDCQDVVVTFFDPEDERRSKVSYLFTIDVSDEHPVSLAPVHTFLGEW